MIRLTALNGHERWVNSDLIVSVEATPDTVVSLIDNHRFVVRETPEQVRAAVIEYRAAIMASSPATSAAATTGADVRIAANAVVTDLAPAVSDSNPYAGRGGDAS